MAIKREPPRTIGGRGTEEDEVVGEFVAYTGCFNELAKIAIDSHRTNSLLVTLRGERDSKDSHDRLAKLVVEFVKTDTFIAQEELGVGPGTPFWTVYVIWLDREAAGLKLFYEIVRRIDNILNWNSLILELE
jgi:hypothetical protein